MTDEAGCGVGSSACIPHSLPGSGWQGSSASWPPCCMERQAEALEQRPWARSPQGRRWRVAWNSGEGRGLAGRELAPAPAPAPEAAVRSGPPLAARRLLRLLPPRSSDPCTQLLSPWPRSPGIRSSRSYSSGTVSTALTSTCAAFSKGTRNASTTSGARVGPQAGSGRAEQ